MTRKSENIIVGISIGDLNGIGPEVVLKAFEDSRMLELCTPVIFGNSKALSFVKKTFASEYPGTIHGIDHLDQLVSGKINVLNIWKEHIDIKFGENDMAIGKYAVASFTAAVEALKNAEIDVLVTAPINKYNIQSEDFKFPGHTDYLAQELQGEALMLLVHDGLRVGLLTDHVPVTEVAKNLTEGLVMTKIDTIKKTLIRDFKINKPRIAVLGLNPHAGDGGVIGKEDDLILKPAIKKLFDAGTMVFGPYPADGFFGSGQYEQFDAVVAAYHDQGLVPFKTLAFGKGVNYTAGLNRIRTSPDHGTAYDIAGKDQADAGSFIEAVYLAIDLFNARQEYDQLSKNPLKIKEKSLESKKGH